MGLCHLGTACPQVADGGTVSSMKGSCKYIEQTVADSRQEVILISGVERVANNSSPLKQALLHNGYNCLGSGLVVCSKEYVK